jgi:hypothetical protein
MGAYDASPESAGGGKDARRLQTWHLKRNGWSQRQVAAALRVRQPMLSVSTRYAMITYREALTRGAFLSKLPTFLRHPLQATEAKVMLRRRIEGRRVTFLRILWQAIYQQSHSPYLQLLQLAGCAYGDLERLVQQEGVEGVLLHLYREGVYLTVNEFQGRRPAVRRPCYDRRYTRGTAQPAGGFSCAGANLWQPRSRHTRAARSRLHSRVWG